MRTRRIPVYLLLLIGYGCASADDDQGLTICTEPRPEVCTMDYTPVCALLKTDGEETWKTYANACSACSDRDVTGHRPGECESGE